MKERFAPGGREKGGKKREKKLRIQDNTSAAISAYNTSQYENNCKRQLTLTVTRKVCAVTNYVVNELDSAVIVEQNLEQRWRLNSTPYTLSLSLHSNDALRRCITQ